MSRTTLAAAAMLAAAAEPHWLFVGTYTEGTGSKGVYRLGYDPDTGKLGTPEVAAETANPSFLAVAPDRKFLFLVNELGTYEGKPGGSVSAFRLDPSAGTLVYVNTRPSEGAHPCHLCTDKAGKHVLAANYSGGNAVVLPVGPGGELGEKTALVQHAGKGGTPRQKGPNAHSVNLDAAGRFAVVADLGLDKLFVYRFDAAKGTLTPHEPPAVELAAGAGPRHFAFHPSGKFAYAINEIDSTITPLGYNAGTGTFSKRTTVSTLPDGWKGQNSTAEVVVHPSGKFVYGSNRGHDSIAAFAADPKDGTLRPLGHQGKGVKTPRNFVIDPAGKFLLVGSQASGRVVVFRIDPSAGTLEPTGVEAEVPAPVCLRFVRRG